MTLTLVITTGLKWSITTGIFGGLFVRLADIEGFKERYPFKCLALALSGLVLCIASVWLFLEWLWSI